MALTENRNLLSAVRTDKITVVLHDAKYRDLHGFCHVEGFGHDHTYQILRRRNDHDSFYRKRLEYRQRHITSSWRHINKQEVQFAPDHIAPELFYHIGNDRTSPDHRILFVGNQKVQGHDLDPILCDNRDDPVIISHCRSVKTIHFGNGGTCDIRIQDSHAEAFFCHTVC